MFSASKLSRMGKTRPLADRFWAKVNKTEGCWEWTGAKGRGGYGQLYVDGKDVRAHRVSWELHHGPIPKGMFVCHHCDNQPCVRPEHLFIGDNAANMRDAFAKGRHSTPWMRRGAIRKTQCKHGHPFTPENTYVNVNKNKRFCRACARRRSNAYYHAA